MDCREVEEMELIEKYLADSLSTEQVEAFEKHYLGCAECFEKLQLHHAAEFELQEPQSRDREADSRKGSRSSFWMRAAAVLLLAVLIPLSWYFLARKTDPTPSSYTGELPLRLTQIESLPPFLMPQVRGGQTDTAYPFLLAGMRAYQRGDYEEAIQSLREAAGFNPDHLPTVFYLGISYLANGEPEKAILHLEEIVSSQDPVYAEESRWFLAKALLQTGNLEAAIRHLEVVRDLEGAFQEEAEEHLEMLEDDLRKGTGEK